MAFQQPLVWRITTAFLAMTLVVSGVFSLSIVAIVHFIEEQMVSEYLDHKLNKIITTDNKKDILSTLDDNLHYYTTNSSNQPLPKHFSDLDTGFTEVIRNNEAFYAYVRDLNGQRYILVQEQNEFEAHEQALFTAVLIGFLVSILGASCLGWLTARRVISPLTRLAQQVRYRDQLHSLAPTLAQEYADDEVGHLAAAFDDTLNKLRQLLEREKLFASDVSHELRTPLMIIASSCELLKETSLDKPQYNQITRIARTTDDMRDLVQTFLMLARSKHDKTTLGGSTTLFKAAKEQGELWAAQFKEKGISFEVIDEQNVNENLTQYNLAFLKTVITNLLRNALHYTEQGQVQLILMSEGFRVEDSGIGIPSEQKEQIFLPFIRGSQTRGEGLGLGLSLVKRICEHQHWLISVNQSALGGSCFQVILNS
ncbi:sensor histidine kinase [Zooshikella harenae]|uniref:histidine kinase n=1 Tax=Zooshikella harenae TaxID=2827238 RepID=A0ABS5ZE99_9GAMM|nr:HAMP domain-containing sensor histidine kinase [Zooshikella harenae]MBU2712319.1 HAMP domain-containing histidine kinase [Zooshikella harenae]